MVIGYVEEILENFKTSYEIITENYNRFYGSKRVRLKNGKIVNFLGIKYSYWGNISKKVVEKIISLGGKEIIYAAKLGSLTSHLHLYKKKFSF